MSERAVGAAPRAESRARGPTDSYTSCSDAHPPAVSTRCPIRAQQKDRNMFPDRLTSRLASPLVVLALGALVALGGSVGHAHQGAGNAEITVIARAFGGAVPAP